MLDFVFDDFADDLNANQYLDLRQALRAVHFNKDTGARIRKAPLSQEQAKIVSGLDDQIRAELDAIFPKHPAYNHAKARLLERVTEPGFRAARGRGDFSTMQNMAAQSGTYSPPCVMRAEFDDGSTGPTDGQSMQNDTGALALKIAGLADRLPRSKAKLTPEQELLGYVGDFATSDMLHLSRGYNHASHREQENYNNRLGELLSNVGKIVPPGSAFNEVRQAYIEASKDGAQTIARWREIAAANVTADTDAMRPAEDKYYPNRMHFPYHNVQDKFDAIQRWAIDKFVPDENVLPNQPDGPALGRLSDLQQLRIDAVPQHLQKVALHEQFERLKERPALPPKEAMITATMVNTLKWRMNEGFETKARLLEAIVKSRDHWTGNARLTEDQLTRYPGMRSFADKNERSLTARANAVQYVLRNAPARLFGPRDGSQVLENIARTADGLFQREGHNESTLPPTKSAFSKLMRKSTMRGGDRDTTQASNPNPGKGHSDLPGKTNHPENLLEEVHSGRFRADSETDTAGRETPCSVSFL